MNSVLCAAIVTSLFKCKNVEDRVNVLAKNTCLGPKNNFLKIKMIKTQNLKNSVKKITCNKIEKWYVASYINHVCTEIFKNEFGLLKL